jgi:hypothetical protein
MNRVHFVEIQQPVSTSKQNELVDDWFSRKPVKPIAKRTLSLFTIPFGGQSRAWEGYEQAMRVWRLEVRIFFKWWPTNEHVNEVLQKSAKDTHVL